MSASALFFLILIIVAIAALIIWLIYSRRYQKASQEAAFVRTGFGGQKIVMSGGALVFPVLHEVIPVNMNTIRLNVVRSSTQALTTKDRMRMDVQTEFYLRVKPTLDDIAMAAQTLGRKTMDPDALKGLVEGKLVNALQAVAAEMNMDELHQNRGEFTHRVQDALADKLAQNGLELESVSLSNLDQTDRKFFNPQNAFDAEGLMLLTQIIQTRAKQRNAIERDTEVAIKKKDLEAEREKLNLSKEEEFARLEQEREIQVRKAEQSAQITAEKVEKERQAKEAELVAKQRVENTQISTEQEIEEKRIKKEHLVRISRIEADQATEEKLLAKDKELAEKDIEKVKFIEEARIASDRIVKEKEIELARLLDEARILAEQQVDKSRITSEKELEQERIAKTKLLEAAEIERKQSTEAADVARVIAILEKTKERVVAETEVDKARIEAVKTEEQAQTARQLEIAERAKAVEIIDAKKTVARETINIIETAEARMKAAISQAEAMGIVAGGEAEKIKRIATAEAEAEHVRVGAAEKRYQIDAQGKRALHEAENVLDPGKSATRVKMAIIEHMAEIIKESVRPLEAIEGIKILHVEGLATHTPGRGGHRRLARRRGQSGRSAGQQRLALPGPGAPFGFGAQGDRPHRRGYKRAHRPLAGPGRARPQRCARGGQGAQGQEVIPHPWLI